MFGSGHSRSGVQAWAARRVARTRPRRCKRRLVGRSIVLLVLSACAALAGAQQAAAVPVVSTLGVSATGETSVTLVGYVSTYTLGLTDCHFEYGVFPALSSTVPCTPLGTLMSAP